MRVLSRMFACLVALVFTCSVASATRINILDPTGFETNPIRTSPFSVTFTGCSEGELPDPGLVEKGCFAGVNRTNSEWTSLKLVIPDFGHSFDCNTDDQADQIFSTASCSKDPVNGFYDLIFAGGSLSNRQLFFITEDDIDPADFPTFSVYATFASTPEPSAFVLLATGLVGTAGAAFRRRRVQA